MEKDIILLLTGSVVGSINAIAGGGMLIGFPLLVAMGIPPIVANATGNIVSAPGQLASAMGYHKFLLSVPKRFLILTIPCLIGAVAGTLTLRHTASADFSKMAPMMIFFGVLLFALQPLLRLHAKKRTLSRSRKQPLMTLVIISIILIPLTFYGGYFGPGFGFMMLAMLGFTTLHDTHAMNAIKNLSATFISTISMLCLLSAHLIDWRTGLFMAVGSTIGGYFAARSAQRIASQHLRVIIVCFGFLATTYLAYLVY